MNQEKPDTKKLKTVAGCLSSDEVAALKRFAADRDWPPAKCVRRLVAEGLRNLGYLEPEQPATGGQVAA